MDPTFGEIVERSLAVLERRRRVSHTALRLEFSLDDTTWAALREELVDVLGAAQDDGRVLTARNGAAVPAGAPIATAEHALITVVLCDLADSAELQALGPERRAALTARLHAICGEVAARLRGHVQAWVSDGVAIFFGHPRAQDDDALRAVRCGWEILRTLAAAHEAVEREFGHAVSVRVGIATGAAGDGTDPANAFGETPRIAARVQAAGPPDRLTVDAATHARVASHFALETVTAPGMHILGAPLDDRATTRHAPTPLVGRTGERALLQALAERAADGTRSAVLVRGEAGVGKTRLLDALADSARETLGMRLLHCAASPYHRGSALHPLLTGLRRHWQIDGDDASARVARRARSLPGGARAVALLASMLGVAQPEGIAALPEMSPLRRRRESLAVLADALVAEARRTPLLLVIEDLHWADPTTIELIAALLDGEREVALMLGLTARREFVPPPSTALQRIELGRLDADESRQLVELVAAAGTLPDGLAAQLADRAGGSPLLAEELTRTQLATQDTPAAIASTLYGCLMARLDRDSTARAVAQLAATIGREFDVTLLEAVGGIERSALDWGLERLVAEDVVAPAGPGRYAFRHSQLQDAARSSLRQEALRDHNLRIARALIASFPHVAEAEPERVARHLEYGGELPGSISHWRKAGLQALAQHALGEATGHFERALELTQRTPDGDERRATELSLRVLAGQALAARMSPSAPASIAHFERAELLARDHNGAAQSLPAMLGLTTYRRASGRIEDALALARRQVAIAERSRDRELLLEAESEAGGALVALGRHRDALPHLARAIELYDRAAHSCHAQRFGRNPAAVAYAHRGLALACRDDCAGARDSIARAAAVLRADPHPYSQAQIQCAAAAAAFICDQREVVLRESAIAIRLATDEGFGDWLGQASVLHGWALVQAGEADGGIEECRRGAAQWAASGATVLRPLLQGLLGDALARAGEYGPGLLALDDAMVSSARGEHWCDPELHRLRAELLLAAGDRRGALRSAQTAVALARRSKTAGWERRGAATLARVSSAAAVG